MPRFLRTALLNARDFALTAGPFAAIAVGLLWTAFWFLKPAPPTVVTLATGQAQGAYAEFGRRYAHWLGQHGIDVRLRETQGGADTRRRQGATRARSPRRPDRVARLATEHRDVQLIAPTAILIAHDDLHPALAQLFVQAARAIHGDAGWFQRRGDFPSAESLDGPLAAEAERYFQSGTPWLQRHLPFWLANLVDRMWVVLLSHADALYALSHIELVRGRLGARR